MFMWSYHNACSNYLVAERLIRVLRTRRARGNFVLLRTLRLRGDAERAAISMMDGVPDGALNTYAPVRDAVVSHNTLIDCKVSLELGVGAGKTQSAAPTHCQISDNLFVSEKSPVMRLHAAPLEFIWIGNKQQAGANNDQLIAKFQHVDLDLVRDSDGLLRPRSIKGLESGTGSAVGQDIDGEPRADGNLAGCDDPRTPSRRWPSADNTGPEWQRSSK